MLSDKILFDWLYPVCMFPSWLADKSHRKWVRFVGLIVGYPWFLCFLPVLAVGVLVCLPIMLWEDA